MNADSVLLVDDKEQNIYLLEVMFSSSGLKVFTAKNGKEALDQLETNKVDLVIADILMPVMDGYQLCREVRSNQEFDAIKFIFYTATYTSKKDEEFALKLGADQFIRKPCDPEEFMRIVKETLKKMTKDTKPVSEDVPTDNHEFLKLYNSRLVEKLEKKMSELEQEAEARNQIIKTLEKSEARLAEAQKLAQLGNWEWDIKNNRLLWSDEVYRIFGRKPDDFQPSYEALLTLVHQDDRKLLEDNVDKALHENIPYKLDHRIVRPDGSIRFVYQQANLEVENDKPSKMLGTIQDITQRKSIENELQELHKIQENRIRQIENLNENLEAFDYSVSNTLRVPIRHIQGFSQILKDYNMAGDSKQVDSQVDRIIKSADDMAKMVDDLMRLSMVGKTVMEFSTIDLCALIRAIMAEIHEDYGNVDFDLSMKNKCSACCDRRLMRLALTNLVQNAIKFRCLERKLKVEFGKTMLCEEEVYFLRDNGIGFDLNRAESIFVPFHNFHNDASFDGMGLGLAMTRRIIERHGGRIWAEGKPGTGATFYFSLAEDGGN